MRLASVFAVWALRAHEEPVSLDDVVEEDGRFTLSNEKLTMSGDGYSFADTRVGDIADDYGFPVSYIADMLVGFGVPPPIRDDDKLSSLVDADQAFGLLEALNSLDGGDILALYADRTLEACAEELGISTPDLFAICNEKAYSLPHGLETQLRREQLDQIAKELDAGTLVPPSKRPVVDEDDDDARPPQGAHQMPIPGAQDPVLPKVP